MDQFSLKGKTAVLTGAAGGLDLAFAQVLAKAGANIAVLGIIEPSEGPFQIRKYHGVKVEYCKTNVTSRDEVTSSIEKIEKEFGTIDINANAAGIVKDEPFLTASDSNLAPTFAVNFTGSLFLAQACANAMVHKLKGGKPPKGQETTTGAIIFIGSISTHITSTAQNISCYVASNSAVRGLVKPLFMELAQYGIRVNSLSPGYMMTHMMKGLQTQQPDLMKQFEKETLFGRIGYPDELKGALLFLASQASGWYTGQDMLADGGARSWKHPAPL